ncbi:Gamma-aminobutyric acid type B receptor subunit 2 [Orchesella cincta]|uniref:Gamma-aminobutyric acid type B receptor subunit 2 n=1 Tax=Orchesella cincta TaxID=48709 RepID=A0A1D2M6X7_ORCCI|nr:Gamma-aminobutyric acid type B receptor subunit 2 [Orchesella cincta]
MKAFFDMMNDTPLKYMLLARRTTLTCSGSCQARTSFNALADGPAPEVQLGTLYQNKPRYSLAHNNLVGSLEPMGVRVVAAQSFADDISYHIHKLKEKDVRIILGNFNETWRGGSSTRRTGENLYGRSTSGSSSLRTFPLGGGNRTM